MNRLMIQSTCPCAVVSSNLELSNFDSEHAVLGGLNGSSNLELKQTKPTQALASKVHTMIAASVRFYLFFMTLFKGQQLSTKQVVLN